MTIEAFAEPSEDGHGFIAVVKRDGKTIYASDSKHGKPGIFDGESLAITHAEAWANCVRLLDERIEAVKVDRQMRLAGEIIVLKSEERVDRKAASQYKKAAKISEENAEARAERVEALALHAEKPRLQIYWDRRSPESVKIQIEESVWDSPFVPEEVELEDDRQLSLPGTNWQISHEDGAVSRAIGHGRVELVVSEGRITIKLGANEHTIAGTLTGTLEHVESRESAPEPTAKPSKSKAAKSVETKMGKLGEKELRDRLPHLTRAETLLGLYVLESEKKKPRARVLKAITTEATNHDDPRLLVDLECVDEKRTTTIRPDRAAAALATVAGEASTDMLDQLVPACGDATVVNDLLDDELQRGESSRDEVVTVLRQRLAELAPSVADDEDSDDGPEQLSLEPADEDDGKSYGYGSPRYDA